jgi:tetratricopeptide (TPR) repeat protein
MLREASLRALIESGLRANLGPNGVAVREQVAEARHMFCYVAQGSAGFPSTLQPAALETLEKSAQMCQAALRRDPENADAIDVLVNVRVAQADRHAPWDAERAAAYLKSGLDACKAVLTRNPKHAEALLGMGSLFTAEGSLPSQRGDEARVGACFTRAASKFQEVFALYPKDEYVHTRVLSGLNNILETTMKQMRPGSCLLDKAASKYEEALSLCEENDTACNLRSRSETYSTLGGARYILGETCKEGYEQKMQHLESAEKFLELAVAKNTAAAFSAIDRVRESCEKDFAVLFGTHMAMGSTEYPRAKELAHAGYYRQASVLWTSAAKHCQRALESEKQSGRNLGTVSESAEFRKNETENVAMCLENAATCLKNAEHLKNELEASFAESD